ncbi:MAG: hypothetical protein M0P69_03105 [Bacteroidales bacterium]|nr:hypothetical protein [Bacteroidales bacterium]
MIKLNRNAFEKLQSIKGWSDTELAEKMSIDRVQVWRVKEGHNGPGRAFIAGALKVFPEASFDELFILPGVVRGRKARSAPPTGTDCI